jgi:Ni,Fe-hydrogenase I cytochrome b subunit
MPIVLAVLVRTYLVRFIHQISLKVYREINVTCIALILGAVGCFIVGFSCDVQKKEKGAFFSHNFMRILLCSIGWTLMDVGFEFALYFANKIKESYEELLEK